MEASGKGGEGIRISEEITLALPGFLPISTCPTGRKLHEEVIHVIYIMRELL